MRIASHIATALSAATARSNRPSDRRIVGVCKAYLGSSETSGWAGRGSIPKPE